MRWGPFRPAVPIIEHQAHRLKYPLHYTSTGMGIKKSSKRSNEGLP